MSSYSDELAILPHRPLMPPIIVTAAERAEVGISDTGPAYEADWYTWSEPHGEDVIDVLWGYGEGIVAPAPGTRYVHLRRHMAVLGLLDQSCRGGAFYIGHWTPHELGLRVVGCGVTVSNIGF